MSVLSGRVGTAIVTLALVALTFFLVAVTTHFGFSRSVLTAFPTTASQLAVFFGLSTVAVLAVRNAIRTQYRVLWGLGVVLMELAYAFLGTVLFARVPPESAISMLGIVAGVVLGVLGLLLLYAFRSSRSFHLWEVYAVLAGVSASVLAVAATRVRAIVFVAAAILALSLMMYVVHVISRFKKSVPHPLRNGSRLYVAITGLPIELALYIPLVVARRFL
jgi:hypothetical protein